MRGRKRLSPFETLMREIEGYMAEIVYQSQLNALSNIDENGDFILGELYALRHILERGYAIYNRRSIGNELQDMAFDDFLKEFREATKIRD